MGIIFEPQREGHSIESMEQGPLSPGLTCNASISVLGMAVVAAFIYNCVPVMEPTGLVTLDARGIWQGIIYRALAQDLTTWPLSGLESDRHGAAIRKNVREWKKAQRDRIDM